MKERIPLYAVASSGVSLVLAALAYPGSSLFNPASAHYSLSMNMLSDLGIRLSYRNEPLHASNMFFALGIISLAVAVLSTKQSTTSRWVAGLVAVLLVGVLLVPSDAPSNLHNPFFFGAVVAGSGWLATLGQSARTALIIVGMYALFLLITPRPSTSPDWRMVHAILQKSVLLGTLIWIGYRSHRDGTK